MYISLARSTRVYFSRPPPFAPPAFHVQPTDLVKIRFQSEGRLLPGQKPRYSGVLNAYTTIIRTEGVLGLWTGFGPAVARNSLVNATELATYDTAKEVSHVSREPGCRAWLLASCLALTLFYLNNAAGRWSSPTPQCVIKVCCLSCPYLPPSLCAQFCLGSMGMKDDFTTHVTCGIASGAMATIIANPVDVVKTRVMASRNSASTSTLSSSNQVQYTGALDCFTKTLRNEGPTAFYKGVFPQFLRITGWNIIMFVTLERLKKLARGGQAPML